MSDSEAIEVVHQMMAARDHEEARTAALASSWSRREATPAQHAAPSGEK